MWNLEIIKEIEELIKFEYLTLFHFSVYLILNVGLRSNLTVKEKRFLLLIIKYTVCSKSEPFQ